MRRRQAHEIRWGAANKYRVFTVFSDTGINLVTVREMWGTISGDTAANFARKYSAGEMARLAQREKFRHDITRIEALSYLDAWRMRCKKAGLTEEQLVRDK